MNPVMVDLGIIKIYYYSVMILIGMLTGAFLIYKTLLKKGFSEEFITDLIFYTIIFGILGARIYYVLFNLPYYSKNILEIFEIWNGGLAIHGGIIGGVLWIVYYCKKKNVNILKITDIYKKCTKLDVHVRHPYAGDLVFSAFSGSHQDAIRKGMKARKERNEYKWEVPYLPIDPHDLGREYKEIIRINSQSGKGGAIYIMENEFGFNIPKNMHKYFGKVVKEASDKMGKELSPQEIYDLFKEWYIDIATPYRLKKY